MTFTLASAGDTIYVWDVAGECCCQGAGCDEGKGQGEAKSLNSNSHLLLSSCPYAVSPSPSPTPSSLPVLTVPSSPSREIRCHENVGGGVKGVQWNHNSK
jgi:hypothetical protein